MERREGALLSVRGLTTSRAVGLAVIGLLALALVFARMSSGGDARPAVPEGAQDGDLVIEPCTYATEDGDYAADCGTLVVSENRQEPNSRLIALPVIRIRARSGDAREPIFRLEGGPGVTNMTFPQASRYAADRDVVLVGYRGVDGSVRLTCPEVNSAIRRSSDLLSAGALEAYSEASRACADRFGDAGVDVTTYGLPQQVDDLEAARVALGYGRINLVSESAGTRTALIYAWRYPESIHRSIMIGVNPPGHFMWDAQTLDEQLGRYAELCAADRSCRERTADLAATMRRTAADIPGRWLFLPINESTVRIFSFYGLMESTPEMGLFSSPVMLDLWLAAAEGDTSGFWLLSLFGDLTGMPFVWGQYAAAGSIDAEAVREYFSAAGPEPDASLAYAATAFTWGGGQLVDSWPAAQDVEAYSSVTTSEVQTLLIGGALDTSTPPQNATKDLLPYLPNGQEVVLPAFGHSMTFWAEQREAGAHLINTFFDSGAVDLSRYTGQRVEFEVGILNFPTLAKLLLAILLGVIALAAVLLGWMVFRVQRRGSFGRKTSIALRVLGPLPLGLGGYFLALLVVMVAWPALFLGSQVLMELAMGTAVGLGVYLAWTSRDSNFVGCGVAISSALVCAWVGFNAAGGLVALPITLVGAAVGANLALIVLDIAWDRAGRQPTVPQAASLSHEVMARP